MLKKFSLFLKAEWSYLWIWTKELEIRILLRSTFMCLDPILEMWISFWRRKDLLGEMEQRLLIYLALCSYWTERTWSRSRTSLTQSGLSLKVWPWNDTSIMRRPSKTFSLNEELSKHRKDSSKRCNSSIRNSSRQMKEISWPRWIYTHSTQRYKIPKQTRASMLRRSTQMVPSTSLMKLRNSWIRRLILQSFHQNLSRKPHPNSLLRTKYSCQSSQLFKKMKFKEDSPRFNT